MKICQYYVYRANNMVDCSNHGISSYVDKGLLFFNCSVESAIKHCKENGLNPNFQFYLKRRIIWGEDHSIVVPLVETNNESLMFGGNFLYTKNSMGYHFAGERTVRLIPIHDRIENK